MAHLKPTAVECLQRPFLPRAARATSLRHTAVISRRLGSSCGALHLRRRREACASTFCLPSRAQLRLWGSAHTKRAHLARPRALRGGEHQLWARGRPRVHEHLVVPRLTRARSNGVVPKVYNALEHRPSSIGIGFGRGDARAVAEVGWHRGPVIVAVRTISKRPPCSATQTGPYLCIRLRNEGECSARADRDASASGKRLEQRREPAPVQDALRRPLNPFEERAS